MTGGWLAGLIHTHCTHQVKRKSFISNATMTIHNPYMAGAMVDCTWCNRHALNEETLACASMLKLHA